MKKFYLSNLFLILLIFLLVFSNLTQAKKYYSFNSEKTMLSSNLSASVLAPAPYNGMITVGATGDFTTINEAVDSIAANGIVGPVIISIEDGTFNEQITLNQIPGASTLNTITFESASGNAADVIITHEAVSSADNYVFLFENTAHIILRNLTLKAEGTTYARTIVGTNNLENILIEECIIQSPITSQASTNAGNIVLAASNSESIRFINNEITGGAWSIYYHGTNSSGTRAIGFEMRDNQLLDANYIGLELNFLTGAVVNGNTIQLLNASRYNSRAAEISNVEGNWQFTKNRLLGARDYGLYVTGCDASDTEPALIANNFINATEAYTLYFTANNHQQVYHNNLNASGTAIGLYYTGSYTAGNKFKNNIIKADTDYAVYVASSGGLEEMDYNNLFTSASNLARWGSTDLGDLSAWQTTSGKDANSLSFDPQYASDTDLYASSPALANAGTPLAEVTTDIDGNPRKATPTIGANEYNADALTPLSGTYTIDSLGTGDRNFISFKAAVDAMLLNGLGGAVIFEVASDTLNEQVVIPDISGGSETNTITFESASGNAADVIVTHEAVSSADNYVFLFENASDIILRNLSINATGTSFGRTVRIQKRADNILIENCIIENPVTSGSSGDLHNLSIGPSSSSNIRLIGNSISGGSYSVIYSGSSSLRAPGFEMRDNQLLDANYIGLYLRYLTGAVVNGNTIQLLNASRYNSRAAEVSNVEGNWQFTKNRLLGARDYGLYVTGCDASDTEPALIANNFINATEAYTLYFTANNHQQVYHNNLNASGTAIGLYYTGSYTAGNKFKNNIIKADTDYAVYVANSGGLEEMDYNNLFTSASNLARWGSTDLGDLSAWQTTSGKDANSLSFDPQYASDTDLYASSPALANAGTPLAEVTTDIDGNPRKATPTIGANEYNADALTPLSGTYTIDSLGTGDRNFISFKAAVDAMLLNGLGGAVIFEVASDTLNEQVVIPDISGGSETNTITFESASGNAADVIVTHEAISSADNYVFLFENASDIILRNLSINATGTSFGRTVRIQKRADNILIENCIIENPVTSSSSGDLHNLSIGPSSSSNIRLIGNSISGGSYSVIYSGSSSLRAPGFEMRDNQLLDANYIGLYLRYLTGAVVNGNTIQLLNASRYNSRAAEVSNVEGNWQFTKNRLLGARDYGLYVTGCDASDTEPALIANNFINATEAYTLYFTANNHQQVYHNNLNALGTAIGLYYTGSYTAGNKFKNNIIKADTDYAVYVANSGGLEEMDYNNLFTSASNLARWGSTDLGDLSAWQTTSGKDANSLSFDPQYASDTDLYASSPALANAGTPLAEVTTDIDGNPRKATPTIGANEYNADALTPLSGTYTIDSLGTGDRNFISFKAAVDAMLLNGLGGAVIFEVASDTLNEQVVIPDISGGSETNTITFEAASGNAADVIVTHEAVSSADNYVFLFENASDIILRNLSINATGTSFGRTVRIQKRADNILIENCIIGNPVTSGSSGDLHNLSIGPSSSSNIRLIGNSISGGSCSVIYSGSSSLRAPGFEMRDNQLLDANYIGLYLRYLTGAVVNGNTIQLLNASRYNSRAAEVSNVEGNWQFTKNRLLGARDYGLYVTGCDASDTEPALIANNFINATEAYTLYFTANNHQQVYHNNLNALGTAIGLYYTGSYTAGNKFKNNIIKADTDYAVYVANSGGLEEMDYNNLFTSASNLARWGSTDLGDLSAWQTTSGKDANSLSFDPQYASDTDLTPQSPSLAETGEDLTAVVSIDINGNPRTVPVSIGAVEFGIASDPLVGDYTIDPGGSGDRNFTTFAEASEALRLSGIAGSVRFLVADTTFTEQLNFGAVSGTSSSFTITFESGSGNPENAIIEHTDTYTMKLENAEYYSFKNLTFSTTGIAHVIQVRNRANSLLFEGNRIISPAGSGTSSSSKGIDISPSFAQDIRIINNYLSGGNYGVSFSGNSNSNKASGTVISENTVIDANYRSLYLNYHISPTISDNIIQTASTASQIAIYVENSSGGLTLSKNRVSSVEGNALRLTNILGTTSNPNLVYNNFLQSEGTNRAIYVSNTTNLNFYHNAVWNQGPGTSFEYSSGGSDNKFVNNIFQSTAGTALYIANGSSITELDYNNLFTNGTNIGRWGNTFTIDLNAWKTVSGHDVNSLTVDSEFLSPTELYPQTEALASNGKDLTAVIVEDIDGNSRTVPVSIGAVEYVALNGLDLAVNLLVSPQNNCELSETETITVQIKNTGTTFAENIPLGYQIDSLSVVEEQLPSEITIAPGETYTYSFIQAADLSARGDYQLRVFINMEDENANNNELKESVSHYPEPVVSLTESQQICQGQYVLIEATGGESYLWNTGDLTSSISVNPSITTTYSVSITDTNQCTVTLTTEVEVAELPKLDYAGGENFENEYVSPLVGTNETDFIFRIEYSDSLGLFPAAGFPKLTLSSFQENLEYIMVEEDALDTDVTDGKIYTITVNGLANDANWSATIEASNGACVANTISGSSPLVSTDFLDIAIFADDILFSEDEPALLENFTITANIRNTSDYDAEDFEVHVYDDSLLVHTDTINFLGAQTIESFEFDYAFTEFGYHEIKVVIDALDSLLEKNELNNFAIRFYALPEGISVTATTDKTTYYLDDYVYVTGQAVFTGLDAAITPPVKNAIVRWTVSDGRVKTTYTNSVGSFNTSFAPFAVTGNYSISGEVDDGRFVEPFGPLNISVVDNPDNVPKADLKTDLIINIPGRGYFLSGEPVSGIASVENVGDVSAENFVFQYSSCDSQLGEITVDQLEPGEKIEYQFTTILTTINDCSAYSRCIFSARADIFSQIIEYNEYNNRVTKGVKQYSDMVELEPILSGSPYFNLEDPYQLMFGIRNTGGIALNQQTNIKVYINGTQYTAVPINTLDVCNTWYQIDGIQFTSTEDRIIVVNVDEPIGSGQVTENDETNNSTSKTITYLPKKSDLVTSKYNLRVEPKYPNLGETFQILGNFSNSRKTEITNGFQNVMTVTESDVARNEIYNYPSGLAGSAKDTAVYSTQIASYGDHKVEYEMDINNDVDEVNEYNNFASMPLCADLTVAPRGNVWQGGFQVFTNQMLGVYVRNPGLFIPSNVSVGFYLDDLLIASTTLDEVPTTYDNYYGTIGDAAHVFTEPGTYTFKVVVDYLNEYEECNEDNNEYSRQITIETPGPDLRVESAYISPTKLNPDLNEPINLFVSYENIGAVPASQFKVRLNIDGVQIGEDVLVDGVASGEDGTVAITEPYSSGIGGTKTIEAIIDVDNEQPDPNRNNNVATRTIFVGDAPNLYFDLFDISDDCPDNGEDITITAAIGNEGDVATTATLTFYHKIGDSLSVISDQLITVDAKGQVTVDVDATVLSNTFEIFAEITDAYPYEYNTLDNTFTRGYCTISNTFELTTSIVGSGLITREPNENIYDDGSDIVLNAVPANGWSFNQWSGDASGTSNPITLTMDSDKNVIANFVEEFRVDLNITNESCVDAGDGELEVTIFAGTPPYTIEWYKNSELLIEETGFLLSNLSAGIYEVRVTDSNSNIVSEQAEIVVGDYEKPNILIKPDIVIYLDETGNGTLTVNDVDNGSFDNCAIDSMHISQNNFNCLDTGIINLTFEVFDTNGNKQETNFQATVVDTLKPIVTGLSNIIVDTDSGKCSATVNWPNPYITDNCEIDTVISNYLPEDTFIVGTTTVIYSATDINGNKQTASFDVEVIDNEDPVVVTQDITVQLDASGAATITPADIDNGSADACGIDTLTLDVTSFDCTNVGTPVTVTLTVTDVNGNQATGTASVTVEDNVAPAVVTKNITVQLDASGAATITPADIDNGSADACGIDTLTLDVTSFDCTNVGTPVTVILTVTDVNGNQATGTASVTVEDNVAPAVVTKNITVQLDASGAATITPADIDNGSADACGIDTLTLDVTSFDCTNVGIPVTVTLTVTDVNGNQATGTASVTVEDNVAPAVVTKNITVQLDASGAATITPADIDNGSADACGIDTLTLNVTSFDCTNVGIPVTVTLTVTDVNGNQATGTAVVTVEDNVAPAVVTKDITVQLDASGAATITPADIDNGSSDACGNDTLTLDVTSFDCTNVGTPVTVTLTVTDVNGNQATGTAVVTVEDNVAPAVVTKDITVQLDASGAATITPADIDNGSSDACGNDTLTLDVTSFDCTSVGTPVTVTLTVTDVNGNQATGTASVTVEDNVAPAVVTKDITVQLDASGAATITPADIDNGSADACGIDTLTLDVTSFDCTSVRTPVTVTLTVTDVNGNQATGTASVTVEDIVAPAVVTKNITVQLDASGAATITPADIDNGSADACGIDTLTLNVTSFDCTNVGIPVTVTLTVTDVNGNQATGTAVVTVEDNVAPAVVTKDITVQLDASGAATITPADIDNGSSDACGNDTLTLDVTSFDCTNVGTPVTVTLTVTDVNGNQATGTAVVTVEDNVAPAVVTKDITVQLDASGAATITPADIDNGSSDACGNDTLTLDVTSFDCTSVGTPVTVTLTVTDVNGNQATGTASVTVEDNVAPAVVTKDITVQLDASGAATITPADIDNGSADACGIDTLTLDVTSFDCTNVGENTVNLTITDVNGNSASNTATVTIEASGAETIWFADNDGDGFGDSNVSQNACVQPLGYVTIDGDCDDNDYTVYPGAPELCDGLDNDCDGIIPASEIDNDGDGYITCTAIDAGGWDGADTGVIGGGDCDDNDYTVYPGAPELCDGLDNDCDGIIPASEIDNDGDGYITCTAIDAGGWDGADTGVIGGGDCDDNDYTVYPGAPELCDGLDNDCDGIIPASEIDNDGDGYISCTTIDAGGWDGADTGVIGGGDCDDNDYTVYPGAPELCDGLDNDCDGIIPASEIDNDGDGYISCTVIDAGGWDGADTGVIGGGDCDDNDYTVYPGAPELCDGLDNDCDGIIPASEIDIDGDGYITCTAIDAGGWDGADTGVIGGGDCDDNDYTVYPGAPELCDGLDNDCDGIIPASEIDNDGDGYITCTAIDAGGWDGADTGVIGGGDCDDNDYTVYPGAPEVCDGLIMIVMD